MTASPSRAIISSSPTFGRYSQEPVDLLRSSGYDIKLIPHGDTATLMDALAYAEAWIAGFEAVNETTLAHANNIKVVAKCGTGMDNFDMRYLAARCITTVNVPGGNARAVAEYTIGQILALSRGVVANDHAVRRDQWKPNIGLGLDGRTIGIIGFGSIGREVAKLAIAFGMSVLITDPAIDEDAVSSESGRCVVLDELLRSADIVSIHVPFTDGTQNLIAMQQLAQMLPHALLINNSRGGILDENALVAALHAGTIGGAALDVFAQEPLPNDSPLLSAPNLILSSHTAGYSDRALAIVSKRCADSLLAALKTRPTDRDTRGQQTP